MYGSQGWWPLTLLKTPPNTGFPALHIEHGVTYGIPWKKLNTFKTRSYDPYFDIAVGAILTQNTAWGNVAKALLNLAKQNMLTANAIVRAKPNIIEKYIRPSGYFKQKTKKLKLFADYIHKKYKGDIRGVFKQNIQDARTELLNLWGIGKETADSIILYAGNQPIFVIDAYTKRICAQHGIIYKEYDDYQKLFITDSHTAARNTPNCVTYYKEFHALIVRWGKENARVLKKHK